MKKVLLLSIEKDPNLQNSFILFYYIMEKKDVKKLLKKIRDKQPIGKKERCNVCATRIVDKLLKHCKIEKKDRSWLCNKTSDS